VKLLRKFALATTLVLPAAASAQGTAVFSITGNLPDTVMKMTGGMGPESIDLRLTYATDGSRIAFMIQPGPGMNVPGANFDLSSVRLQAIFSAAKDSISLGIVLPPEITAALGGGIGYRLDFKLPQSLPMFDSDSVKRTMDSIQSVIDTGFAGRAVNTGQTAVVAGITCEVWNFSTLPGAAIENQKLSMCLAPTPAFMEKINTDIANLPLFKNLNLAEFRSKTRKVFGGRDLVPVRMTVGEADEVMQFELISINSTAPDASFFTLPVDLQPFPIEMFMPQAGSTNNQ
jgi:hypothetical protein